MAAAAAAALAAAPGRSARHVRAAPGRAAAAVPWPDLRLWVAQSPDGGARVARQRSSSAILAFDAYSRRWPGTREVRLGEERFFAFVAPRLGADHLVVWRRTQDVRDAAADRHSPGEVDAACPLRLTPCSERQPLTGPVYSWDKLDTRDPNRYWDDGHGGGPWMYWESFWAPAEAAAPASSGPAFGDPAGRLLAPLLGAPGALPGPALRGMQRSATTDGGAVSSTATAFAMKDRAYAIVYQYNVWGSDVSRSGTGSDLWSPEARLATTAIEAVVDHFGVRSMLDCACGDATWMVPFFVNRHSEVSYCGVDIVPEVIEQNRQRHPQLQFLAMDLAESPLPTGADLVFSKETLNHMPLEDAQNAIERFRATGAPYLLTNVHHNADNEDGRGKSCYTTYIKYDYELPPFNMKKLASIVEYQGAGTSFSLFAL